MCLRKSKIPEQSPRYEFYSYKKTRIVQKPIPRYDRTCGKYADTLLNRAPRYDPRSGANPYPELRIITWNIVFEKKKIINFLI